MIHFTKQNSIKLDCRRILNSKRWKKKHRHIIAWRSKYFWLCWIKKEETKQIISLKIKKKRITFFFYLSGGQWRIQRQVGRSLGHQNGCLDRHNRNYIQAERSDNRLRNHMIISWTSIHRNKLLKIETLKKKWFIFFVAKLTEN